MADDQAAAHGTFKLPVVWHSPVPAVRYSLAGQLCGGLVPDWCSIFPKGIAQAQREVLMVKMQLHAHSGLSR